MLRCDENVKRQNARETWQMSEWGSCMRRLIEADRKDTPNPLSPINNPPPQAPSCNEICALGCVEMSASSLRKKKKASFANVNVKLCSGSVVWALGGNMQMVKDGIMMCPWGRHGLPQLYFLCRVTLFYIRACRLSVNQQSSPFHPCLFLFLFVSICFAVSLWTAESYALFFFFQTECRGTRESSRFFTAQPRLFRNSKKNKICSA